MLLQLNDSLPTQGSIGAYISELLTPQFVSHTTQIHIDNSANKQYTIKQDGPLITPRCVYKSALNWHSCKVCLKDYTGNLELLGMLTYYYSESMASDV